jgi:putative phosphoribosyl transferase
VAISAAKQMGASRIIVAVPVGSPEACGSIAPEVSELICPLQPQEFAAVGSWYVDFEQTDEQEVEALLAESAHFGKHGEGA